MKFMLDSEDLWEYVQPPTTEDHADIVVDTPDTPTLISEDERKKKKKAAYLIYRSSSALPQSYVAHQCDPAKMWATLKNFYS